jgi:2,3-bisphosphoglycerate-independent phosphoglycerate mutase
MSAQVFKGLVVILDGVGDRPKEVLGGLTPLEAASTPHFDRLVQEGQCGLVDPLLPGVPVDTHVGTGVLLGLAPHDARKLARGPVEAAGAGVPLQQGDVAVRCNFATVEQGPDGLHILDRRAGRISTGVNELAASLKAVSLADGITGSLHPATNHRAVLRLTGRGLSGAISDTDPGSGTSPAALRTCRALDETAAAMRTAEAVNHFVAVAYARLSEHPVNKQREAEGLPPANGVITRGAGSSARARNLVRHLGLRAALVSHEATVVGLGHLFHFTTVSPPLSPDGGDQTEEIIAAARDALTEHDLVFVHFKSPDIFSHDRDPEGKRDVLARIDAALAPLLADDKLVIAVGGDHASDSLSGRHIGDPVPSLLRSPGGRRDGQSHYGESTCMSGGLGRIPASGLLWSTLDAMGVLPNIQPHAVAYFL